MRYQCDISFDNTKDGDQWFGEIYTMPRQENEEPVYSTSFCSTDVLARRECQEWIDKQK